jgi:hypothetical protein
VGQVANLRADCQSALAGSSPLQLAGSRPLPSTVTISTSNRNLTVLVLIGAEDSTLQTSVAETPQTGIRLGE